MNRRAILLAGISLTFASSLHAGDAKKIDFAHDIAPLLKARSL